MPTLENGNHAFCIPGLASPNPFATLRASKSFVLRYPPHHAMHLKVACNYITLNAQGHNERALTSITLSTPLFYNG